MTQPIAGTGGLVRHTPSSVIAFAVLLVAGNAMHTAANEAPRPNIVLILADDLGIGDVNCYGGDRCLIETPNVDRLAAEGLRFTDAHVNASVCVPTRVAIMTGRYPWRFGPGRPGGAWGFLGARFEPDTFTIGDLLQQAGYRTGYVGKWHLGTEMKTKDGNVQNETNVDYTQPLTLGPVQFGFDESFILPGSLDMYPYAFAKNNVWQGNVTAQKGWSAFNRIGPAEEDFEDHEVLETFYRQAESFLMSQTNDQDQTPERPFFLYLALTAPHTPTSPGVAWRGKSELGVYGDFVMEVDHAVKRVRDALRAAGTEENTLILFASDHGPAPYAGNILQSTPAQIHLLEQRGHYPSGPYRGYKFSVYEGGLRVPLIAHWPGVIGTGGSCDALVGLCDLMSTFAELAGVEVDSEQAMDSISFAPLLRNPSAEPPRKTLIMQSIGPFVIRQGQWKLCLCPGSGATGNFGNTPPSDQAWADAVEQFGRTPTRDQLTAAPFVQLFDLANDPHEDRNLASEHPQRVAQMVRILQDEIERGEKRMSIHPRLPAELRKQIDP